MKRKIFLRVFFITLLSVTIVFVAGIFAVSRNNKTVLEERLAAETEILAYMLQSREDIDQLYPYRNDGQFRVSIISEDGEVLSESSIDGVLSEDHSTREEVVGALAGEPRAVRRYSETFGCNMTYYALARTLDDGETVVIRVAIKSEEITSFLGYAIPLLLIALAITVGISLVLSRRLSRDVADKIQSIAVSLSSIGSGEYVPLKTDTTEPELCAVFEEINELNEKTYHYVEAEKSEKQKLSAVLDNISQGIIAVGKDGEVVFTNDAAAGVLGESAEAYRELILRVIELDGDGAIESTIGGRDYSITVRRIADGSLADEISLIVILTDITVAKAVAKEKSDFFANASHELKTPITVMQGNSELILSREELDPTTRKQVERIHKEALRMSGLIADMLKLSNLELQKEEPLRVCIDLRHTCEEVVSELAASAEAKELTVSVEGEGTVLADPKRIYELVGNLCSNAINYNKQGGAIGIRISSTEERVVLSISDTGIGIPAEHLPRICERFYRVDKSRSKKSGGTGLGLAIVKHICVLYDAELAIDSTVGEGTQVTVAFKKP